MENKANKHIVKPPKEERIGVRVPLEMKKRIEEIIRKDPELDESQIVRKCVIAHLPYLEKQYGIEPQKESKKTSDPGRH